MPAWLSWLLLASTVLKRESYKKKAKRIRHAAVVRQKALRRRAKLQQRVIAKRAVAAKQAQERLAWYPPAKALADTLGTRLVGRTIHSVLEAPIVCRFGANHHEVCDFVDRIRLLRLGKIPFYLDFTKVKDVGPAAALYIAAELDRMRSIAGVRSMSFIHDFAQWDPSVRTYLGELGLYEILKVRNRPPSSHVVHRRFLKMRRDKLLQQKTIPILRKELERLVGRALPPDHTVIYDAILEAMQNVVHHAYQEPDPRKLDRIDGAWWWTAAYDEITSDLQIVFLDQGAGIPIRLPNTDAWGFANQFMKVLGVVNDGTCVRAALEYRRSTYGTKSGRGRGFNDIMNLVDAAPGSWLRVLSGSGECLYRQGKDIEAKAHPAGIVGTIVQWNLHIGPELSGATT